MSKFHEMKDYIKEKEDYHLAYDSPFSDYIDKLYSDATAKLSEEYSDLFVEPSIQCGRGRVFATYVCDGVTYHTNWDFESECEAIFELASGSETEEEFCECIRSYLDSKLSDADIADDEEEDM